jgi:HD-GYP domain-containing protein (c-di-GMP phosphodiesterase class II)
MHDIGKIAIPDVILNKPGRFTPEEYDVMKQHAALGGEILDKVLAGLENLDYYQIARDMAVYHHEWWNGQGYPYGRQGEAIPLSARIMAVADVFDALVAERPYKHPFSMQKAYKIIEEESGTHFDAQVVQAFIAARPKIEKLLLGERFDRALLNLKQA